MYHVTKVYPHSLGLSVAFRQHRAKSHCAKLHGYALAFTFEFCAMELRDNWVIDFGGLKELKSWLVEHFDHRMIVAYDDPKDSDGFLTDAIGDVADVLHVANVGMEAFAKYAWDEAVSMLHRNGEYPRVQLAKVTVAEHEGNSASYSEPVHFD